MGKQLRPTEPVGGGLSAGRVLMEDILVSLVLFKPKAGPYKAFTLLTERESF